MDCWFLRRRFYNLRATVAHRLQIVISSPPPAGLPGPPQRQSFWHRFKLLIAGACITVAIATILVVAVILGWIVAAVLCLLMIIVVVAAVLKATIKRVHS
jgi:hypothetical protein